MTGKFIFRAAMLVVVFSLALPAAPVNIFTMTPIANVAGVPYGDWATGAGTYNTDAGRAPGGVNYGPVSWSATQIIVGGVLDPFVGPPASKAVSATNLGVNDPVAWAANGNTCVGAAVGVCTTPDLETALGILTADLNNLLGDPTMGVASGSAIAWTYTPATANTDTLSVAYDFVANEAADMNDFGFFVAKSPTVQYLVMLGSVQQAGDFADYTGYFSYTFPTTEAYTFAFGVVNVGPYTLATGPTAAPTYFDLFAGDPNPLYSDSALLLDPVPEPGTWMLAGAGLLLAAISRLRKAR